MKKVLPLFLLVLTVIAANAQGFGTKLRDESWKKNYRAFSTKVNDLVHTKLEAKFDYSKSYMNGKVAITLKPHFYATDSLQLDAKGMTINTVQIVKGSTKANLKYTYENDFLNIKLDRTYQKDEQYTVYIDYVAKPDEFEAHGSAAIKDAKGLYFINPKGDNKEKATQIWTQGETEGTSVWVPTIDRPNQKSTNEFYITVPAKYVTLSNGKLMTQTKNADGTRTDYWKMDLPHAPYLFFMGIGDFAVVKDTYKGKEVSYYVEKQYEPVARKIFGNTPEMMKYFSTILGVEYPWVKYGQMVGLDYVSGAMENTTATLHQESAQQNARQLVDGNGWESTVAHELFHQWFGDYVTAESWSNLTVNESFANYSQVLWDEYKYGKDAGDAENEKDMMGYLMSGSQNKDLVRYYYRDKEDMFDAVSYNKGGRILHMLRNLVGDSAFFKSLNLYLTTNKFGTGNAHKLRLAFETVTGKDLNWYWNQWYFGNGHPKLEISHVYDPTSKIASVYLKQSQTGDKIFRLPIAIEVYHGKEKKRYESWMDAKTDTISFYADTKPDLINVDADKILLADKKETDKSISEYVYQYNFAKKYKDRSEALTYAAENKEEAGAYELLVAALNDPYAPLREKAIHELMDTATNDKAVITKMEAIAKTDVKRVVREAAIDFLGKLKNAAYKDLFIKGVTDSSYSVAGASLIALSEVDEEKAISFLPELKKDSKGRLKQAIEEVAVLTKGDADFDEMYNTISKAGMMEKFNKLGSFLSYLTKVNNVANFKKGLDFVVKLRNQFAPYAPGIKEQINQELLSIKDKKEAAKAKGANAADMDAQKAYIDEAVKN